MKWIDEMLVNMEQDRAAASAKRSGTNAAKVDRTEHLKKQVPATAEVWNALVSSIKNDVNDFNKHKKRAGQTSVCVRQSHSQCEVYLPGMHSRTLVLTLDNNDLQVSVHPDFPKQQSTIKIEPDKEGQHGFWVLGDTTKESAIVSVQQLSEYLLKPILSSGAINREL